MSTEINNQTKLAYEGSKQPLTDMTVVGNADRQYPDELVHFTEPVAADEMRVTILGSGDPFVKKGQASASVMIEVGNKEKDILFFDLGSGALANYDSLQLPVTATTKVFLTHLHADHTGDLPTLIWSLAKAGRRDPVEVWGPSSDDDNQGTLNFTKQLEKAFQWDTASLAGHPGQSGARMITTEVPYDKTSVVYERNGVKITSFPVIHILNGAVGYKVEYAGLSVVMSGDSRPSRTIVDSAKSADLLIHETFPCASVYSKKANVPINFAETIVNGVHTSPMMAGKVFSLAEARMSVMWHLAVDHDIVGPVFEEMRTQYSGPVTIAQDLTTFSITKSSVVVRQASANPVAWPVIGKTVISGPPMSKPNEPPEWWAENLITD